MAYVFICYRRADTREAAVRLSDQLTRELGVGSVFLDSEAIEIGTAFPEQIAKALERAEALIVLIGPAWLREEDGAPSRLDRPDDFVRREIRWGLERGIPVYPVLVDGAELPTAAQLPSDLASLVDRQATRLNRTSFLTDAEAVANRLRDRSYLGLSAWVTVGCIALALVRSAVPNIVNPVSTPNGIARESATTLVIRLWLLYLLVPGAFIMGARGFFGWNVMRAARLVGVIALGGFIGTVIRVAIDENWPTEAHDFRQWIDVPWIIVWLCIAVIAGYAQPTRRSSPTEPSGHSHHRAIAALAAAVVIAGVATGFAYRFTAVEQPTAWTRTWRSVVYESRWIVAVTVLMMALPTARRMTRRLRIGLVGAMTTATIGGALVAAALLELIGRATSEFGLTSAAIWVPRLVFPLWVYGRLKGKAAAPTAVGVAVPQQGMSQTTAASR